MIKLYGHEVSGNSYKVRLLLSLLNLEYEWIKVDLMKGEHKSPEFLALNPFGQVPLLVDGDTILADAQSILVSSPESPHYTCTQVSAGMDRSIHVGT
ncbi:MULTISPECIES: glutathione S-transferase N-terminal domain-containing protein [unclassified Microcoleus]|uniref:glutathione S-transferase N-terminal domain-containing protein n=1 Tax=unclassified Microcoleus TaxID=2642155 RepID=UPI002FCF9B33